MRREVPLLPAAATPTGSRSAGDSGPSPRGSETSAREEAWLLTGIRDTDTGFYREGRKGTHI